MQLTPNEPDRHGGRPQGRSGVPLILATFALGSALALTGPAAAADKPNILVLWGDDIGQSNISTLPMGWWATRPPTSTVSPTRA